MSNELNGTTCLLYKGSGAGVVLAGQMEFSVSYGGALIDL